MADLYDSLIINSKRWIDNFKSYIILLTHVRSSVKK